MVTIDDLSQSPSKDEKREHPMGRFRSQRQEKEDEGNFSTGENKSEAEYGWLACLSGIASEHEVSTK